jgi:FAD:protein FMN transferase
LSFNGCTKPTEKVYNASLLDFPLEVRLVLKKNSPSTSTIEPLLQEWIKNIDAVFNEKNKDSEINQINQSDRLIWLAASRAMVSVVETGLQVARMSQGAWDFTSGKLNELYRDGKKPGPNTLAQAKTRTGYFHVEARQDPLAIKKNRRGLSLDLRALALGYAVDEIAESLRKAGHSAFHIQLGPISKAFGTRPSGDWEFAFENPVASDATGLTHVATKKLLLQNQAAVHLTTAQENALTSIRQWVDPRTGLPLSSDLLSVTVLDASALKAMGFSVGFIPLGHAEAMAQAQKMGTLAHFVSVRNGESNAIADATALFPSLLDATH